MVAMVGGAGLLAPAIACAQTAYVDPTTLTARLNQSPPELVAASAPEPQPTGYATAAAPETTAYSYAEARQAPAPTPYSAGAPEPGATPYAEPGQEAVPAPYAATGALAYAETPAPARYDSVSALLLARGREDEGAAQLNRAQSYVAATELGVLAPTETTYLHAARELSMWAATEREVWVDNAGDRVDRVRLSARGPLRRESGSPLPPGPFDRAAIPFDEVDVAFTRGWTTMLASGGGLDVTLTPHAGVRLGSSGTAALAGATVQIGPDLDRMVPEGRNAFGERARWYLYAAGQGRAVGYNFARNRDGDYDRSGYSRDEGIYLGDASIGLAWRKGDMHSAVGLIYREIEPGALVHPGRLGADVNEGLLAFSLSIKPGS